MTKIALLIDYGYCSGCHSCELACRNELELGLNEWGIRVLEDGPRKLPNGTFQWDYVPHPTDLCTGCAERVAEGLAPACVQTCQAKVMYYGTPQEMAQKMEEIGENVMMYLVGGELSAERAVAYDFDVENSSYTGPEAADEKTDDESSKADMYYLWKYSFGKEWELIEKSPLKELLEERKRQLGIEKAAARASNYGEDFMYKITDYIPSKEEMLEI